MCGGAGAGAPARGCRLMVLAHPTPPPRRPPHAATTTTHRAAEIARTPSPAPPRPPRLAESARRAGAHGSHRPFARREDLSGRHTRARRLLSGGWRRRVRGVGGAVGVREVDAASARGGARDADGGGDPDWRPRRYFLAGAAAERRDGVPGLCALSAHDGARESGVSAADAEARSG